jgi:hypothetical protein
VRKITNKRYDFIYWFPANLKSRFTDIPQMGRSKDALFGGHRQAETQIEEQTALPGLRKPDFSPCVKIHIVKFSHR